MLLFQLKYPWELENDLVDDLHELDEKRPYKIEGEEITEVSHILAELMHAMKRNGESFNAHLKLARKVFKRDKQILPLGFDEIACEDCGSYDYCGCYIYDHNEFCEIAKVPPTCYTTYEDAE